MSKRPRGTPWTPDEEEFVRECYGKMPVKEIARVLGRKVPMVYSKANEMGLYIKGPRPPKTVLQSLRDVYQEVT